MHESRQTGYGAPEWQGSYQPASACASAVIRIFLSQSTRVQFLAEVPLPLQWFSLEEAQDPGEAPSTDIRRVSNQLEKLIPIGVVSTPDKLSPLLQGRERVCAASGGAGDFTGQLQSQKLS